MFRRLLAWLFPPVFGPGAWDRFKAWLVQNDPSPEETDPDPELAADIEEAVTIARERRDKAARWLALAAVLRVPWWQSVGRPGRN